MPSSSRLASNLSAGVVASIAAWSSYQHMVHVALGVGERPDVAYVLPLSVDGMLVVASVAMVDDRRGGRRVRWSARVAFAAGVTASVAANVAGAHPTIGARIVAAWPAIALLLTVELLSRAGRQLPAAAAAIEPASAPVVVDAAPAPLPASPWPASRVAPRAGRLRRGRPAPAPRPVSSAPTPASEPVHVPAGQRIPEELLPSVGLLLRSLGQRQADVAGYLRVHERTVRKWDRANGTGPGTGPRALADAPA